MFNWLLLLVIYLPFQVALNPRPDIDLASLRVFILLLFGAWLVSFIFRKDKKPNYLYFINPQAIYLLFFLLIAGFSILMSENYWRGIRKFLFFLSIFPLYFLSFYLINNISKIKKVIWGLVSAAGITAFIGLIQFLAQFIFGLEKVYMFWALSIVPVFSGFNFGALILAYPSWLVNISGQTIMRAFSLFSDPHMLSFYIGLILPLVIILLYQKRGINKRNFQFLSIVILYFILYITALLSFTRGAYLALFSVFIVLSWIFWKYFNQKIITFLLLLSLLIFIIPGTPISARFYSIFDLNEGSNLGRFKMWQEASQLGRMSPWWGEGLGNYSLAFDKNIGYRNPMTAHNFYLDIFSEMGIFSLIIWLILILGTILGLFKIIRSAANLKTERHKDIIKYREIAVGLLGSLLYFSVHSFFETSIYNPVILGVLMVIFGLSAVLINSTQL